jgi:hypothetical protein
LLSCPLHLLLKISWLEFSLMLLCHTAVLVSLLFLAAPLVLTLLVIAAVLASGFFQGAQILQLTECSAIAIQLKANEARLYCRNQELDFRLAQVKYRSELLILLEFRQGEEDCARKRRRQALPIEVLVLPDSLLHEDKKRLGVFLDFRFKDQAAVVVTKG